MQVLHAHRWHHKETGESFPLVLLHGFGGCGDSWSTIAETLSMTCEVLAFDLPGHGVSLGTVKTGVKASVAGVLHALDQMGIETFHLAGHSMGGAAAALIAQERPQRVKSLTLLAPGGVGPDIASGLLLRFAHARSEPAIRSALAAMHAASNPPSHEAVSRLQRMRQREGQTEALVSLEARLSRNGIQGELDRAAMARLSMPVSLVWGEDDPVVPIAQAQTVPPHFILHRLPGCGHMLLDEAPEAIAGILRTITA